MLPLTNSGGSAAFQGPRASYVALAAITTLALALVTSIWSSDVSGSTAILGLLAVYMASPELLILYAVFSPSSVLIDIIRLSVMSHSVRGRGWLIFFSVCEMAAKCAGAVLAWSLHKSINSAEGEYQSMTAGGGGAAPQYHQPQSQGGFPHSDPFAAYTPPQPDALHPPMASSYQPFPTSQPATVSNL